MGIEGLGSPGFTRGAPRLPGTELVRLKQPPPGSICPWILHSCRPFLQLLLKITEARGPGAGLGSGCCRGSGTGTGAGPGRLRRAKPPKVSQGRFPLKFLKEPKPGAFHVRASVFCVQDRALAADLAFRQLTQMLVLKINSSSG